MATAENPFSLQLARRLNVPVATTRLWLEQGCPTDLEAALVWVLKTGRHLRNETIEAALVGNFRCPACDHVMQNFATEPPTCRCANPRCLHYQVAWVLPTLPLRRA